MGREASSEDESAGTEVVTRSPSDVLRLVVADRPAARAVARASGCSATRSSAFVSDLLRGFQAIPKWIVNVLAIGGRILAVAVLVFGLLLTILRSGWRMLVTVVVAAALGAALVLLARTASWTWPTARWSPSSPPASDPRPIRASPRSGASAGHRRALTAAAPWLSRGWRRWGWVAVARPGAHPRSSPRRSPSTRSQAAARRVGRRRGHARRCSAHRRDARPPPRSPTAWPQSACRWRR